MVRNYFLSFCHRLTFSTWLPHSFVAHNTIVGQLWRLNPSVYSKLLTHSFFFWKYFSYLTILLLLFLDGCNHIYCHYHIIYSPKKKTEVFKLFWFFFLNSCLVCIDMLFENRFFFCLMWFIDISILLLYYSFKSSSYSYLIIVY